MAGFFGLFGKKTKYVDDVEDRASSQNDRDRSDDFFLNADEAKSLGNTELMRSPEAKVPSQNEQVASTDSIDNSTESERRRSDSELDVWRNVARQLKR